MPRLTAVTRTLSHPEGVRLRAPAVTGGMIDRAVAELAARQHGVVGCEQLMALGLTKHQIAWRVRTGRLHRVHRGVYAVGHCRLAAEGRFKAATLAADGAVLSHRCAAALLGCWKHPIAIPEVTTTRHLARRTDLLVHQTRRLTADEVTVRLGIPVTTVVRTYIDLAEVAADEAWEDSLRHAERRRLIDRTQLRPIPGRRAAGRLLRHHEILRSVTERRFKAIVRRLPIPPPVYNARWGDDEIDALWPDERIAVELDGYDSHSGREAFRADRRKDIARTRAGLVPARFTYHDVTEDPRFVETVLLDLVLGRGDRG